MTRFGLVLAGLQRKRSRTLLTLLSLGSGFLLFGLLQAVNVLFGSASDFLGATRLITQARVSFTQALPMSMLPQLESIPGVKSVSYQQWFGAYYQEPKNFFAQFAVDPERFFESYPEWSLPDDQKQAFASTRTGIIVGEILVKRFGWKIGDRIPLQSTIWPQQDGSKTWEFEIVGIFTGVDEEWSKRANLAYLNFAFFDEARQFGRGGAGIYILNLTDETRAAEIATAVDARFENSVNETKTQTEKDFNIGFAKQIGDIGLIVSAILGAVFFTLLLLTGNVMAQSVRERIPEFAILKTLGFSDASVLRMVLAESAALCLIGGLGGLLVSWLVLSGLGQAAPEFAAIQVDATVWLQGLLAMAVLALLVGLPPALKARKMNVVDALAGR